MRGSAEITEDVSWKDLLSSADLEEIARSCGDLNRHFGYSWPATS
jgi:hypothetical protein